MASSRVRTRRGQLFSRGLFQGPIPGCVRHSDAVFLQLAAAFDAFACAIAHNAGLPNPHKADFASWNALLATETGGELGTLIKSTAADPGFDRLISYRNVAAHRSLTTARTVLRTDEET